MASNPTNFQVYFISFMCFIFAFIAEGYDPSKISSWCKQTPHPKQCEYYLTISHNKNSLPINQKSDFLKALMQSAMETSKAAHQDTYSLGAKFEEGREKAAWGDCLELYELAIHRLNQAITKARCTKVDVQTWLSSALTHHQACLDGLNDLNLTNNYIMPLILSSSRNASHLISNALAINKGGPGNGTGPGGDWAGFEGGFPGWVRPGDRRLLQSSTTKANLVVAQDGSGDYNTIGEAVSAASGKRGGGGRFVIHIKAGTYKENVVVRSGNIMFLGDGIGRTIITGSKSVGGGSTTFQSATVGVIGDGFMAQGITFRNTAGPGNHQAVALRSTSDLSVFYRCGFEGYQDTLYVLSNRQFYRECDIYGTVDFIFGNAAVVLQSCNIYARYPPAGTNTVTAQGRADPNQNTGISIHNSRVAAGQSLGGAKTYLGRPWKQYSRTVFLKTYLDSIISPQGWAQWSGNFALSTLYYGEYANTGPGSSTANRVKWPGYHVITSPAEAGRFTVGNFIAGGSWLPGTGVPFTSGL